MAVTETKTISYGSRIGGLLKAAAGTWFLWKKRAALKATAGAALEKAKS